MNLPRPEFPVTLVIAKEGELCWLGHLDFARAVERALRRSGLPLRFTEGFHRRVKMRLPEPLPVGVGSEGERFVVPLAEERSAAAVAAALGAGFPRGLRLVAALPGSRPEPLDVAVELDLAAPDPEQLDAALEALPAELPAIGGAWVVVEAVDGARRPARARVRLTPRSGGRVSVGRFLALLNQAAPGGFALERVHRRVAWNEAGGSLPSSAPLARPYGGEPPEAQESSPCTP